MDMTPSSQVSHDCDCCSEKPALCVKRYKVSPTERGRRAAVVWWRRCGLLPASRDKTAKKNKPPARPARPRLRIPRFQAGPQRLLEHTGVCLEPGPCSYSCILFLRWRSDNIWLFIAFKPLSPLQSTGLKATAHAGPQVKKQNKKVFRKLK